MPHKYEREIEEILRNMDLSDSPRRGVSGRIDASARPAPRPRMRGPRMSLSLNRSELLLLTGVVLALVGVCVAYFDTTPTLISGIIGLAAFAAIVAGLIVGWMSGSRSQYAPSWRASSPPMRSAPMRDNVVRMRPRRRGPIGEAITRVRILWLKLRYWRMRNR
jgi:hypothetical protein